MHKTILAQLMFPLRYRVTGCREGSLFMTFVTFFGNCLGSLTKTVAENMQRYFLPQYIFRINFDV